MIHISNVKHTITLPLHNTQFDQLVTLIITFFAASTHKNITTHFRHEYCEDLSLPYLWVWLSRLEIAWKLSPMSKPKPWFTASEQSDISCLDYILIPLLDQSGSFLLHISRAAAILLNLCTNCYDHVIRCQRNEGGPTPDMVCPHILRFDERIWKMNFFFYLSEQ